MGHASRARTALLPVVCFMLQCFCASVLAAQGANTPQLEVDLPLSREGYFVLSWETAAQGATVELQRSDSGDFSAADSVAVVPAGSLTLTGLRDGAYYFRVGTPGNWSPVQEVQVQHHALSTALLWFAAGACLFLVLLCVILAGTLRLERAEREA